MIVPIPWIAVLSTLATPPPTPASAIAPILGPEAAAVAHFDLTRWDVPALLRRVADPVASEVDLTDVAQAVTAWGDALKKAGAKDLFVIAENGDLPGLPVVAVPLGEGADGPAIVRVLVDGGPGLPVRWPATVTTRGLVVAGSSAAIARIRDGKPGGRPDLVAALDAAGDAPIRLAISPGVTLRRAVEETLPTLPAELGGGPIEALTRGMTWASFALTSGDRPTLRVAILSDSEAGAKTLGGIARRVLEPLAALARTDPAGADLVEAVGRITPEVQKDRVVLEIAPETVARLAFIPIRRAQLAARRAQSVNNLKQIGLALHNYHSAYDSFPPAFVAGPDGKPLLSWRVLILPYIEQGGLYDQFRRDEPWDSPHNKALIARMPATFAAPAAGKGLAAGGKTTYLTLRGPDTLFPGAKGVKIQEVTDGTSNTIAVVEAGDGAAVVWTKPDDWEIGVGEPAMKSLFGRYLGGTNFGFADGSVRFLKETINTKLFRALSTRAGGDIISPDEY